MSPEPRHEGDYTDRQVEAARSNEETAARMGVDFDNNSAAASHRPRR
jgi:hypothetical protein